LRCASRSPASRSRSSQADLRSRFGPIHAFRSHRLPSPRSAPHAGGHRVRRLVRHVERRHPRGFELRSGHFPDARRPEHASGLRHRAGAHQGVRCAAGGERRVDVHVRRDDARADRRAASRQAAAQERRGAGFDHRRALPRLLAPADFWPLAPGRLVDRRVRARVRGSGVRARRKIRRAKQARPTHSLAGCGRARRQHGARLQEHALRMERGHRRRRVGSVRAHARHGDPRHRSSGLVASKLRDARRGRSARPVPVRGRHAGRDPRSLHAGHGTRARSAALEPGSLGVARVLQDPRRSIVRRGEAPRAQDSVRCPDARRARRVEGRDALQLRMGSRALPRRPRRFSRNSRRGAIS